MGAAYTSGYFSDERGTNLFDSGTPFYDCYETADGEWLSVAALEAPFYADFLIGLGLADGWSLARRCGAGSRRQPRPVPQLRDRFTEVIASRTLAEWIDDLRRSRRVRLPGAHLHRARRRIHTSSPVAPGSTSTASCSRRRRPASTARPPPSTVRRRPPATTPTRCCATPGSLPTRSPSSARPVRSPRPLRPSPETAHVPRLHPRAGGLPGRAARLLHRHHRHARGGRGDVARRHRRPALPRGRAPDGTGQVAGRELAGRVRRTQPVARRAAHLLRRGAPRRRAGAAAHGEHRGPDAAAVRHRRAEATVPAGHPGRARRTSPSATPNRRRAPTWPRCRPRRCATATSG